MQPGRAPVEGLAALAALAPRCSGGAAWRREFWPPVCAEQVAALVAGLVRRGGWVHSQAHKLQYAQVRPGCGLLSGTPWGPWTDDTCRHDELQAVCSIWMCWSMHVNRRANAVGGLPLMYAGILAMRTLVSFHLLLLCTRALPCRPCPSLF